LKWKRMNLRAVLSMPGGGRTRVEPILSAPVERADHRVYADGAFQPAQIRQSLQGWLLVSALRSCHSFEPLLRLLVLGALVSLLNGDVFTPAQTKPTVRGAPTTVASSALHLTRNSPHRHAPAAKSGLMAEACLESCFDDEAISTSVAADVHHVTNDDVTGLQTSASSITGFSACWPSLYDLLQVYRI